MLYTLQEVLDDIKINLENQQPFSVVRLGDGDLKLLDRLVHGKINPNKFDRSGIPHDKGKWLLKLYRRACNDANYTSSFEMYYTDSFWDRKFSSGTKKKIINWKELYEKMGITNTNFCNPEIGHLLFLTNRENLLEISKDYKVCLITCFPNAEQRLKRNKLNVSSIIIPKLNAGHYNKFEDIKKQIQDNLENIDLFLIGAGALGKGYSFIIKQGGGIAVDVGQVMNYWAGQRIADRFRGILNADPKGLTFRLTKRAKQYRKNL